MPEQEKLIAEQDVIKMGLEGIVNFTGLVKNPTKYYCELDVFIITSREDPFPLVGIEAGMYGIPIICFENATGTEEVTRKTENFIVPYLNIEKMTEKIFYYYNNPDIKILMAQKIKRNFPYLPLSIFVQKF